jgi:exodeoxyribonuclease V alpha subunit
VAGVTDAHELLAPFRDAGVLVASDTHIAAALDRLVNGAGDMVVLAAALAARSPRLGHVCVDLEHVASTIAIESDASDNDAVLALAWPEPTAWLAALRSSVLVSPRAGGTPLVLDASRLYLERYWCYEREVADDLLARAATVPARPAVARADVLDALLTGAGSADQRAAVAKALDGAITVIAGGPGTGKTTTIAAMLAALVGDTQSARIALAAPTGKAAARLAQALQAAAVQLPADTRAALSAIDASTIHRLLGREPGSASRFRHGVDDPLPHDVIVVDETSMVSLPLMAKLLAAVRRDARLVLVGDPDQLASVEAGAVLGDITAGITDHSPTDQPPTDQPSTDQSRTALGDAPLHGPLSSRIALLRTSRRFAVDSPIGALAAAVRNGDTAAALDVLRAGTDSVSWFAVDDPAVVPDAVRARIVDVVLSVRDAATEGDAAAALRSLDRLRVLCAHRRGAHGVTSWNARIERWLRLERPTDVVAGWYRGRPVLVTANDYRNNLFNGDIGVVVDHDGAVRVAFEGIDAPRKLAPAALDVVDTVHAMTIHKSQGSEFDHAVVVLPPPGSPLLSRELLYTALTRARHGVTVLGPAASIEAAIERRVARATGLRDALWHEALGHEALGHEALGHDALGHD